jgi:hypothetical protein
LRHTGNFAANSASGTAASFCARLDRILLMAASANVGDVSSTGPARGPVEDTADRLRQPDRLFLLDQHLTKALLGMNFELPVVGDLGTRGQGFTPVANSRHLGDALKWAYRRRHHGPFYR